MNVTDTKQIKVLNIVEKTLLFSIFMIILVSPSAAQDSLIILNSSDVPTMLQNVKFIESFGGTITHKFPPHILIGDIPASQHSNLVGRMNIMEITTKPVDNSTVSEYGKTAEIAVNVWNNNYMRLAAERSMVSITGVPEPGPILGDMLIVPENATYRRSGKLSQQSVNMVSELPVQTLPYGAGFYDTSEYMIGDIAVGIILLESNGAIDANTEDWTPGEESNVVSEIQAGLNWWAAREPNAKLTFTYDIHYKVPTPYEPITRPGPTGSPSGQSLWITNAMTNLGYTNYPSYFDNVYDYNNAIRRSLNTDWAFTIFVVDSSNDGDGMFTDGYFAYAYLGGPFVVMTYKNDGYGITNMDAVTAHETGHIFYALDQYNSAQQPCTKTSGYLNIQNQNSEYGSCSSNVDSIMRGQVAPYTSGAIDTYARQQIGWRDTDADGILDIIDFLPASTLNTYSPDPTNDNTPTYTGRSTTTTTYPNNNPYSSNDITINKITSVQYRVDGGAWISASPVDGSFNSISEYFTFTTSILSDGTHTIYVRAQNTGGNWETAYASDTLTVDNTPPGNITVSPVSYQRGSAANNRSIIGFNASATDPLVNNTSAGLKNASVNASLINNTGRIELTNQSGLWKGNVTFDKFIADGNYSLNVTFFDNAGNKNDTVQINISIDNTPPGVTNLSVTPDSPVSGRNANITASVSDIRLNTSGILVEVRHPKGYINTSPMNGEQLFYNNYTNTSEYGRYNVTIITSDLVGNVNTVKSWFVTVMPYVNQSVNTTANNATGIDALNEVNTTLELAASNNTTSGTINMTMSSDVPPGINRSFALTPLGKYIEVNASESIKNNLTWIKLKVYYTGVELAASGLDENSLKISWYNESADPHHWETLAKGSPSWVNDAGVNTTNINNYSGYVWVNISHLSTFALSGTPTATTTTTTPSPTTSSSGGGPGGAGGGPSGENYSNILVKENYDLFIFKDIATSYAFTNKSNPVEFVNITGNISAGEISVAVEVLKGTSTLVNISPPGIVYKNINIWVGTSGFATPKNIKEATVEFRVDKNWIKENDIKAITLLRYDTTKKEWVSLPTRRIRDDTEDYQGETDRFSPFVISGEKAAVAALATPAQTAPAAVAEETPVSTEPQAGFEYVLELKRENAIVSILSKSAAIILGIIGVLYIRLKRKSKR